MKFRFTMAQLKEFSNKRVLQCLIDERTSDLNPYSPLSKRLKEIRSELDSEILNYSAIFEAVLSQKKMLPALMGIDDGFDKLIAERLKNE